MKRVQLRDDFSLNSFASTILNRLRNKGLLKLLGGVKEKHLAEDDIKEFLQLVLDQGLSTYDVVTLASQNVEGEVSNVKETDGVWRMQVKIGDKSLIVHKKDVLDLAVKSYREEAMKALSKY